MPASLEDFSKLAKLDSSVDDCLIRRLDRWTEVLGPILHHTWMRVEGIPHHAWDERVFQRLGECLGTVLKIDEEAKSRQGIDGVKLLILRDPQRCTLKMVDLEVDGVRFCVSVVEEDDCRCFGKIRWSTASRTESDRPEIHDARIAEKVPTILGNIPAKWDFQNKKSNSGDLQAVSKVIHG
eukprot:TRINITY_DN21728_c0_g2_i1.p2 TRINITY_DN21728_c0_g2~~TRINITY_DN21728_c0_g2_i1.p2  ORF type:complete len:181 (+),score=37.96 TRINITY_DN21728_c0_g2_i1:735-1277(+)